MNSYVIQPNELELLQLCAWQKRFHQRAIGKRHYQFKTGVDINLFGLLGEYAFAKFFNFCPDLAWAEKGDDSEFGATTWYDFKLNNGKTFEIKTTDKTSFVINCARGRKKLQPDYYVMCRAKVPNTNQELEPHPVEICGWTTLDFVKKNCPILSPERSPYWQIHMNLLKPLTRKQYA